MVTIYIETHCKHQRKYIYPRWAVDKKNPSMYSSLDPLYTEGTEQVVRIK